MNGSQLFRPLLRKAIATAVCILAASCAAVPKVNDTPSPQPAHIVGASGPLTAQQSRALLDRIAPEPGDAGILQRHTAIEEAVAETPLVAGNATRLLIDGRDTFAAMFAAIRGARTSINLEYYILEDVESGGAHLGDLLIAKRQQGVAVNIIYDSVGSSATPPDLFRRLKDAGIQVVEFNPFNPVTFNFRDHRKILVVDGEHAIVGGIAMALHLDKVDWSSWISDVLNEISLSRLKMSTARVGTSARRSALTSTIRTSSLYPSSGSIAGLPV